MSYAPSERNKNRRERKREKIMQLEHPHNTNINKEHSKNSHIFSCPKIIILTNEVLKST
jgi:hypothetical protein